MATLGDVLSIAGAATGTPGLGKIGELLTAKKAKRKKRKLTREALSIQRERNQILKDRNSAYK